MKEQRRRAGSIAWTALSAGLVASVSVLSMAWQADFAAPPRYDGAGYAVLARSILEGQGYRALDHPDRPRHAHFPPGYPIVLALVWRITGYSPSLAHQVSCVCTLAATLAAWCWFRRLYPRPVALLLGLALAVNWVWARTGSAIQSEPLFELLGQLTILAATRVASKGGAGRAAALGCLLAACLLTRHVALGLALAVVLDLWIRRCRMAAVTAFAVSVLLVSPWIVWSALVGREQSTQAGLLLRGAAAPIGSPLGQAVFYIQRIPDQLTGPLVEYATVIGRSPRFAPVVNAWAVAATAIIAAGWLGALRRPRRRLAGLIPLCTLILLVFWPYTEAGRFLVPLIPCLLVGATEGWTGLLRLGVRIVGSGVSVRKLRLAAALLVLAAALVYPAYRLIAGRPPAETSANREFDAACAWLAAHADRPGPVLTRHPGEVFLATGLPALEVPTSERPGDQDAAPEAIAALIDRYGVAYLLIDEDRYLNATLSPLARFVAAFPGRAREVWAQGSERSRTIIYEVITRQFYDPPIRL
jgi:hypothetical protein